ncbi:hypothetical protein FQA39_LY08066 [Lamprigera yunnana]|nr:hypothetical protein FQA39_LY08066 [Lamprigera yunnana]
MRTKYKNEIWDKIAVDLNYSNDETENLTDNDTIHSPSGETPADEQNENASEEVVAENVQESSQDTTVQVSARATLKTGKKRKQMETLLKQILEDHIVRRRQREEERKQKTNEKPDSLYQFFLSMYHDTKEMLHISQLRIKRKLFEAAQVEESAVLLRSNTTHSLSPQSSVELRQSCN